MTISIIAITVICLYLIYDIARHQFRKAIESELNNRAIDAVFLAEQTKTLKKRYGQDE